MGTMVRVKAAMGLGAYGGLARSRLMLRVRVRAKVRVGFSF